MKIAELIWNLQGSWGHVETICFVSPISCHLISFMPFFFFSLKSMFSDVHVIKKNPEKKTNW